MPNTVGRVESGRPQLEIPKLGVIKPLIRHRFRIHVSTEITPAMRAYLSAIGRKGGLKKSERKSAAAKERGMLLRKPTQLRPVGRPSGVNMYFDTPSFSGRRPPLVVVEKK